MDAYLFFDIAHKLDIDACMKSASFTADPKTRKLSGGGLCSGNWNNVDWNMYFALEYDAEAKEIGTLIGDDLSENRGGSSFTASIDDKKRFGVYFRFDKGATVRVKLSISFVSEQAAKDFLASQIPDFDYDRVRDAAREAWQRSSV